ncbi:MAG: CTP-dependent riboflavin kinase [Methanobacterium sp.]|jgi:riboflavin kinase|nr:CTP-dependent riboflavin kinase [Methanobacterium sp.]
MEVEGKVISGTRQGSYFMSLDLYQEEFLNKLGFKPFPGTLNIEISVDDAESILDISDKMGIIKGKGNFGDVKFLPAQLNGKIRGAILFPLKTHHSDEILEFVSDENLRKTLHLKDGDGTTLQID